MSDQRDRSEEELAEVAGELAEELQALREDLDRDRRRRTPLGLPRPPRPSEVLRLADEFAIPALIALLEANIKLLKGVQQVIRLADREREARERGRAAGSTAADAGRATMQKLQDALDDLGTAIENGAFPDDRAGSDVLEDVRDLQGEIENRLESAREQREAASDTRQAELPGEDPAPADGGAAPGEEEMDDGVEIDVDAELDSLRERYREEPGDGAVDDGGDNEDN